MISWCKHAPMHLLEKQPATIPYKRIHGNSTILRQCHETPRLTSGKCCCLRALIPIKLFLAIFQAQRPTSHGKHARQDRADEGHSTFCLGRDSVGLHDKARGAHLRGLWYKNNPPSSRTRGQWSQACGDPWVTDYPLSLAKEVPASASGLTPASSCKESLSGKVQFLPSTYSRRHFKTWKKCTIIIIHSYIYI